ncbi:MAG: ABC transporter substrate-binding protein, partial [Clostridia bacterium]|nr:ABC transporter substrate-binding protein [Clostridia bacterium]
MKKVLALLLALAMVFSFAACGKKEEPAQQGGNQPEVNKTTFKIGLTGPLTGPVAIYGTAVKNGAQIAVDEINKKGDIKFEYRAEDDEHDTEKADNAYNTLIDWGMQIMLGTVTSAPAEVTAANADRDRMFFLTPSASSSNVTEGKSCVFQMCFTDP